MSRMCKREKKLIIEYAEKGLSAGAISQELSRHGYQFSRESVRMFLIRSRTPVQPKPRIRKIHQFHYDILKVWLNENSSQTARELRRRFLSVFNLRLSTTTVKNMRRKLDWTKAPNQYGQMISAKNKRLRMEWCLSALARRETFEDVIFVDETCVELKASGRFFFYQRGLQIECPSLKVAKPKHPYKMNLWGGISYRGTTNICIFTGIMDSIIYQQILERNFLPFVAERFPDGYRLYQDNDSKHKSRSTVQWMEDNGVADKCMVVPASSPDFNPIECVWGTMKDYLQRVTLPKTKDELMAGIRTFWEQLDADECGKYIDHIHKALPRAVLNHGGPSGL